MYFKRHYLITIALCGLSCTAPSLADKLQPRFSTNGYVSDYTIVEMDLMTPISGNQLQLTYFNPAIAYGSDNQGYADLGLGHRWIHNNKTLLGVYLFGGYTRVEHDAHLWVANPGLEAMGRRWDAHLNGYLSMGDKNYHYFDGLQDISSFFRGHGFFYTEQPFNLVHHTGNGADLKFGYQLFSGIPLRGYLGGYYFHTHEVNNIGGGAVGLEYWFDNHIKSFANYTYDNLHHSTGAIGLGIELGGTRYHRSDPCIEERLTDPVERYLAELRHGSAIPGKTKHHLSGAPLIIEKISNIAFFSQNGSSTLSPYNCTFENPCGPTLLTTATATTLNNSNALPGTKFYFNGGKYVNTGTLELKENQSLHSLTADYTQLATDDDRTTLSMLIKLVGNNTLENLIVNNNDPTSNILINTQGPNNLIIGSNLTENNTTSEASTIVNTGLVSITSSITIKNSLINASNNNDFGNAYGIRITNIGGGLGTLTNIINSEINTNLSSSLAGNNTYGISTITPAPDPGAQNKITLTNTKITTLHNGFSGNNSSINLSLSPEDTGMALNSQFTIDAPNLFGLQIVSGTGAGNMTITNGVCTINRSTSPC